MLAVDDTGAKAGVVEEATEAGTRLEDVFEAGGSLEAGGSPEVEAGGSAPRVALSGPAVTATAKAFTAWIEGPAGRQFSMPGNCAL